MIRGHQFQLPFSNQFKRTKVVILDTESIQKKITVLGYYRMGDAVINCVLFEQPTDPPEILKVPFFRQMFKENKLAIYNAKWEQELFHLPDTQLIELMQYPYAAKEEYIAVQSLDKMNSRSLPNEWGPQAYFQTLFHNYSCVVKEILLYAGQETYGVHNLKLQMKEWFDSLQLFFRSEFNRPPKVKMMPPEMYEQLGMKKTAEKREIGEEEEEEEKEQREQEGTA